MVYDSVKVTVLTFCDTTEEETYVWGK